MQSVSIPRLIAQTRDQTQDFVRQEVSLLKAEASEKLGHYREAGTTTGIGAFGAYSGVIVALAGLGLLVSFALQTAGLNIMTARAAGMGAAGLLAIIVGALVLFKGIKALSKSSIAPERTLYTLQRVRPTATQTPSEPIQQSPPRSAKDMEADVKATQQRLGRNIEALAARVSPTRFLHQASRRVQAHPLRWNLTALATGFAGSIWFVKKLRR